MRHPNIFVMFLLLCGAGALHGQQAPALRITKEMRIDGVDQDLVPIGPIAVDLKGNVALTQWQDYSVRVFSDKGAPVSKVGRKGAGPGEFLGMSQVGWVGDTLWVFDANNTRFTLISPAFAFMRTAPKPPLAKPAAGNPLKLPDFPFHYPQIYMRDGSMINMLGVGISDKYEPPAEYKNAMTFGHVTADGTVDRLVLHYHIPSHGVEAHDASGKFIGNASLPFTASPVYAAAPNGSRLVVADADIEGKTAGTFAVTAVSPAGQQLFMKRFPFRPQPIPKRVADSTFDSGYTFLKQHGSAELAAAYKRAAHAPPMYPPIRDMIVGRDGTTWVGMRPDGELRTYVAISPAGALAGQISLPRKSKIGAADAWHIWVLESDEDDIQSVVRYKLDRPVSTDTGARRKE